MDGWPARSGTTSSNGLFVGDEEQGETVGLGDQGVVKGISQLVSRWARHGSPSKRHIVGDSKNVSTEPGKLVGLITLT